MAGEVPWGKTESGNEESETSMNNESETKAVEVKEEPLLAIHPGKSGGVALRVCGITGARAMPATEPELVRLLAGFKWSVTTSGYVPVCVLERVEEFAGPAGGELAEHYGFLKGALQALGFKVVLVEPEEWQTLLGSGTTVSDIHSGARKWKLKAEAQRRFPHLTVAPETAEALLMLDWAMDPTRKARLAAAAGDTTSNPDPHPEQPCVTRFELAQLMQVSVRTVDRMIAAGEIPVRRVRGQVRFLRSDVEEYLTGAKLKS